MVNMFTTVSSYLLLGEQSEYEPTDLKSIYHTLIMIGGEGSKKLITQNPLPPNFTG